MSQNGGMEDLESQLRGLRQELDYLRKHNQQNAARVMELDIQAIAMRHELEEKRRGFSLMAELAVNLGRDSDYGSIFDSVSRRINVILNMQRTVVLVPAENGLFRVAILQGYPPEEQSALQNRLLGVSRELLSGSVLLTAEDDDERLADLRSSLNLPYLISAPVYLADQVAALLITGRMAEKRYYPRLGANDAETVRTVGAYLAALLASQRFVEAERRNQIMLNAMPLCCTFWDHDLRPIDCNDECVRLFALADKQEYLDRFNQLMPEYQPDGQLSAPRSHQLIREALDKDWMRYEWTYQKLDGELVPAEVTLVRVKMGTHYMVAAYTRDLREHKAMLAAMHKTQDELRLAGDLAEKNARAKSEFLANMSHEIRTPMNAILGMLHLLVKTDLSEKQARYLAQAESSTRILLLVINDILDFSKIEAGQMSVERTPFSLRAQLGAAPEMLVAKARSKGLELLLELDGGLPGLVVGDPLRLEQVLLNLVNNAIKFTENGKITVRANLLEKKSGRAKILVEVEDTGIGIAPDQADTLFKPFSQADTSTTRKYGGTGLGLAISYSLIQLMDGEMGCRSVLGQGSTFWFSIWLDLAIDQDPAAEPVPENLTDQDLQELQGMKILLAEDNEVNQLIAMELLAAVGVETTAVANGLEAIRALDQDVFDLILMDIQMPEMDGLSATGEIRANPAWRHLPIVAMTAHAMVGDREISLASGMDAHLTKPISPQELYREILYRKRHGRRTRA